MLETKRVEFLTHSVYMLLTALEFYIQKLFTYSHGIQCARKASENVSSILVCTVFILFVLYLT